MKPKKIILIIIDTLRADHLGCYGYERNTSPNIDKLSEESILFNWVFSPSSYTYAVHSSVFSGKYPGCNSFGFDGVYNFSTLNERNDILLSDILNLHSYDTAIFTSCFILSECKIDRGFKNKDGSFSNFGNLVRRKSSDTNKKTFDYIDNNKDKNFFLCVHYFDIHGPYIDIEPYNKMFINDSFYNKQSQNIDDIIKQHGFIFPKHYLVDTINDLRYYIAKYDGGIKCCDDAVGELIVKLKELNIYEDSLIILMSDHGESFGEFGVFGHASSLLKQQIHVPLIIKPHKNWTKDLLIKPKKIDIHVSLVDIMPTILDLLNYDYSKLRLNGLSLRKLIEKDTIEKDNSYTNRTVVSEMKLLKASINKEYIHIFSKPHFNIKLSMREDLESLWRKEFLFNYRNDPMCLHNICII